VVIQSKHEKNYFSISYEGKRIPLQVDSCTKDSSLEYINHIQNDIIQYDEESQQQGYDDLEGEIRDLNKTLTNKDE
jgi:hypothetical protein